MAIAQVQKTSVVEATGSAAAIVSFGSLPAAGRLIVVSVSMYGDLNSASVTVGDNQGNPTYTKAIGSGAFNGGESELWYTYNIGAPAGTFTITATAAGFNQYTVIQAVEWSGFGATDPLTGTASSGANNSYAGTVGPTGALGVAEALMVATIGGPTSIVVEVVVPAWTEDGVHLTNQTFESDSRIVTDGLAQSCAWTIDVSRGTACIAAFAATPATPEARWTQAARHVMWSDPAQAQLTQMARHVMYTYTCVPGPAPAFAAGCPQAIPLLPVTGRTGCDDEV